MAESHDELMDHSYDGIQEYDNPLPRWWLWLLYGTIIFSAAYIPYYAIGWGPSSAEEYDQEIAAAGKARAAPGGQGTAGGQGPAAAAIPSLEGNPEAIAEGKGIYSASCSPCHGAEGQGGIGPNLTDDHWLHGHTHKDIVNVVTQGVPAKGMIAWKVTHNPQKIQQVAAFVGSLKGSNPPNPKEPQGTKVAE